MLWYKSIKKINSESGVGWRLVWSISLCPSARTLLCQGIAMCLVLPSCVGRCVGAAGVGILGVRIGMGRGGHSRKGLEMPALVHSYQRNLRSQEAPGLVLIGITWDERAWDPRGERRWIPERKRSCDSGRERLRYREKRV